jgi:hypothetical protein
LLKASENACCRKLKKRQQSLLSVFQLKGVVRKLWSIPFIRTCLSRASTQCDARYSRIGWPFGQSIIPKSNHLHWLQISSSSQNICGGHDIKLKKHYEWHDFQGPGEPITGAGGALLRLTKLSSGYLVETKTNRRRNSTAWSNCPSMFGSA